MLPARSQEEAYLFAEFCPCDCDAQCDGWELTDVDVSHDEGTIIELTAVCPECGRVRTLSFALPARSSGPPPAHFGCPDDPPSRLFDPAAWWFVSEMYRQAADARLATTEPSSAVWADPVEWIEQVGLLTRAAAALDEMARFLPVGEAEIPAATFWSANAQARRESAPEVFTRAFVEKRRAERWSRVQDFCTAYPEPPEPDETEDDDGAIEPDQTELRFARSGAEADLFVQMHPCACGESEFEPVIGFGEDPGGWLLRYSGRCVTCGSDRMFMFRQRPSAALLDAHTWANGDMPSRLLDAGEWLWVAEAIVADYPVENGLLVAHDSEQLRDDLRMAAAAVDEVMKFVPDGANVVPDSAFWSDRGRNVRESDPGRFSRYRLEAIRAAYLSAAAQERT